MAEFIPTKVVNQESVNQKYLSRFIKHICELNTFLNFYIA